MVVKLIFTMKYIKIIIVTLLSVSFLVGAFFFAVGYLKPSPGGVYIDTIPSSNVYINGKYMDVTPYKNTFEVGKVKIKMVPNDTTLSPYETEVDLKSGIQSVIMYKFSQIPEESNGYVLSFDKQPNGGANIVVVSDPEGAQVFIDNQVEGFAPYKSVNLEAKKYKLSIKKTGYDDMDMSVKLYEGYKLNVLANLAKSPVSTPSPEPTPSTKTYIEILDTPTGFLRVRTEAGSKGEEIAEVKPGSKFLFLEEDSDSGWYKIQYKEPAPGLPNGIQGWVSNQYSKKVEE